MLKPITIARRDYMTSICNATNASGLPAFVIVEVLENVLEQVRPLVESELKRDEATYRAAVQKADVKEDAQDGGPEN